MTKHLYMSDSPDIELPEREPAMPDDALGLGLDDGQEKLVSHKIDNAVDHKKPKQNEQSSDSPAYRVLARKYRPQNFKELIGQDAMVQTLGNAIKRGRLAHAFLMTGVRGVGKTSTARLIAKALNCIGVDGQGNATIDPCGSCEPCHAIAEGRHIDVIEMDAASHTGVDDVREIIEAVRYASVSARYKIYIIDEVHMLSKNAFNALLKTLEEPPAHVKFLFATTEVNKVPITVLSRCQRFDLKRISVQELAGHFAHITKLEQVKAEDEALALIARSAEGSVRDGLSILDQAIAHADWANDDSTADEIIVTALQVRDMLGLSDRSAIRTLLSALLKGDVSDVMEIARSQYQLGIEPYSIISGLLREVHMITLAKLKILNDPAMAQEAKTIMNEWGDSLSFPKLHSLWQLLLQGHEEIQKAAMPSEACDMALLRILHASQMPDPSELMKMIQSGGEGTASFSNVGGSHAVNAISSTKAQSPAPQSIGQDVINASKDIKADKPKETIEQPIQPPIQLDVQSAIQADVQATQSDKVQAKAVDKTQLIPITFDALIDAIGDQYFSLESELRDNIRLVKYEPPMLDYQLSGRASSGFEQKFKEALFAITGERWILNEVKDAKAMPSQYEKQKLDKEVKEQAIRDMPLVKAALAAFPNADLDKNSEQYKRSVGL